jgi:hypothetical protein
MKLDIVRFDFTDESTIGGLSIDGLFFSWTLEDPTRTGPKLPGETCIPCGRYRVIIDWSNRFQRMMPHILDVPDFLGIRFHVANKAKDVAGCIGLGYFRGYNQIWDSRHAFEDFFGRLEAALKAGEEVWLTIKEGVL